MGPKVKEMVRNPYFIAAIAGMITIPLLRPCMRHVPEPLPVTQEIPEFALIDQDGNPFGSAELEGTIYVVNFFFSSCPSICPQLMTAMADLQDLVQQSGNDIHLVSITVDPENDTPEVLRAYGEEYGADFERWHLLTGDRDDIVALVVGGFKTAVGERTELEDPSVYDITHSAKLILVDGQGRQRGPYFDADEEGVDEIFHRAHHVLFEETDAAP